MALTYLEYTLDHILILAHVQGCWELSVDVYLYTPAGIKRSPKTDLWKDIDLDSVPY